MNFKGFESPKTEPFTKVPNEYLEYTSSPECDLSAIELRIMNFFFRETYGWKNGDHQLVASVTDFQAMFGIQKRKSVIDALDRLTKEKRFLQSVQIRELSPRTRKKIQTVMNKTLHPAQKLYRLHSKADANKGWGNVRNWNNSENKARKQEFLLLKKTKNEVDKSDNGYYSVTIENEDNGYQSVTNNGYQSVTNNGYQSVTNNGYQSVTNDESESLEPVMVEAPLKKGLKKDLKKVLKKNIYLSEIVDSNLLPNTKKILADKIDGLFFHSISISALENHLNAKIELLNENQYINCFIRAIEAQKEPVKSFESFMDVVVANEFKTLNRVRNEGVRVNKPIRDEKVFEYMDSIQEENQLTTEEIEQQNKELEELIKSLNNK
ncbi:hypothetical protein [Lysinibacillus fusiformis]|uniref:hypothetical protein n=1 Tax=Lysinibacillus fusiformis TaxID=28031 RepID=UPI003CFEA6D1